MSRLLPCGRSAPPLTTGWRPGEVWLSGRGASCSPSLLELSSPLPEALAESEELLLLLLLICSITSTSARSSVDRVAGHKWARVSVRAGCACSEPSPLLMSSSWGSGEGLSLEGEGEVFAPAPGLVGARNWELGWLDRTDCCSIRAWILLLPSALKHTKTANTLSKHHQSALTHTALKLIKTHFKCL